MNQPADQSKKSQEPAPAATAPTNPMTQIVAALKAIANDQHEIKKSNQDMALSLRTVSEALGGIRNHLGHIDERVSLNSERAMNHVKMAFPWCNDDTALVLYGHTVLVTNMKGPRAELDVFVVLGGSNQVAIYFENKTTITASSLVETAMKRDLVQRAVGRPTHIAITGHECENQPDVIDCADKTGLAVTMTPESLDQIQVLRSSAGVSDFVRHALFQCCLVLQELKDSSGGGKKKDLALQVVRRMSPKLEDRISVLTREAVQTIPNLLASAGAAVGVATRELNLAKEELEAAFQQLDEGQSRIDPERALDLPEKCDDSLQDLKAVMEGRILEAGIACDARRQMLSSARARVGELLPRLPDFYGGKAEEVISAGRNVIDAAASAQELAPAKSTTGLGTELKKFRDFAARLWGQREAHFRRMLVAGAAPSG